MTPAPASTLPFAEYLRHDAIGLAGLVRSGEVGPHELLDAALARTEAINPKINAVTTLLIERARAEIDAGLPRGPFTGVPFLLKDLFIDLKGVTTTSGSVFLKDTVARQDSIVAERYRQAGLVLFGKTHSSEFGGSATSETMLFGATRNPWDLQFSAGGSSGGSAAAVAAGIVPAANGSDAGGSIRTPASYCGLFGLKPTRGRVPLGPARFDGGGGIATIHALTRSVRDSAALLDAVAGAELGAPYASPAQARPYLQDAGIDPAPLRIALMRHAASEDATDAECDAAVLDAARLCAQLGHHVEEAAPPVDAALYRWARDTLRGAGTLTGVRGVQRTLGREARPDEFENSTQHYATEGLKVSAEDVMRAREAMYLLHRQVATFMTGYDLILSPSTALAHFRTGTLSSNLPVAQTEDDLRRIGIYTALFNLTGQPAMSVPLYWTAQNLPLGVHFAARFGDEATLFQLAGQLERARPWMNRLPASTLAAAQ
jgi:amidase/6-aminohexanoate-cyclic-dimer hydrolase